MPATVLVAGAGSWGTSLAILLARNGNDVYIWDIDSANMQLMKQARENLRYLPGFTLPINITCLDNLSGFDQRIQIILLAVPCHAVRDALERLSSSIKVLPPICLVCKGMEPGTQLLCHEIVHAVLGDSHGVAILSGPSFAAEVAAELPTAVTLAARDANLASDVCLLFHNDNFRVYTNDDVTGVAIAGAVKNVLAIAAGIADGLGFGANTRAALITRGLAEIMRLGVAMGGRPETFMGLSGLGDLVLTCTDDQSRNRRLGLALAAGESLEAASQRIGQAIEGAKTVKEVCVLADRFDIDMPISAEVLKVINYECSPKEAVKNLLSRDPKPEQS